MALQIQQVETRCSRRGRGNPEREWLMMIWWCSDSSNNRCSGRSKSNVIDYVQIASKMCSSDKVPRDAQAQISPMTKTKNVPGAEAWIRLSPHSNRGRPTLYRTYCKTKSQQFLALIFFIKKEGYDRLRSRVWWAIVQHTATYRRKRKSPAARQETDSKRWGEEAIVLKWDQAVEGQEIWVRDDAA